MSKKDYITNPTLFGKPEIIGFGDDDFCIKEIDKDKSNDLIRKNHYSHKIYNGTTIHLGVYIDSAILGVLQFGYAMNPASCGSVVMDTEMNQYLELNRMWLSDSAPKNSESRAISYSIKYIRGKYPKIKWIQSFADERCNCYGVVYQACSFNYYGEHTSVFWELDGEVFHNSIKTSRKAGKRGFDLLNAPENKSRVTSESLRQFRYIKFLDQRWKSKCLLKEKPYPKHYDCEISKEDSKRGSDFRKGLDNVLK